MNRTPLQQAVVIDLDGTLLHSEPEAIAVQGQSGCSYMSHTTLEYLQAISAYMPIVIATGRNAQSVERLVSQTSRIRFGGFVLEHGLIARHYLRSAQPRSLVWEPLAILLSSWRQLPGYEQCLGLIPPSTIAKPREEIQQALKITQLQGLIIEERHKLFVCPTLPDKLTGLQALGIEPLFAVGNDLNDLSMLSISTYAVTLNTAKAEVRAVVAKRGGYCSPQDSHQGSETMLAWVLEQLKRRSG